MKKILSTIAAAAVVVGSLGGSALAKPAARPANDDLASARAIEALPFSETADLRGATLEAAEAQPSCGPIRGSVWYALSPSETGTVIGEASSTFPAAVAVYQPGADGVPVEIGCTAGAASQTLDFEGSAGTAYLIQVGSTTRKQGFADLSFRMSSWKDVTLVEHVVEQRVDEQRLSLVRVKGQPRESDPSMYDVTLTVGQQQRSFGILTYGLVTHKIERELLHVPAIATKVRVQVTGRYDSSQYRCALDDGAGNCYAGVPLRDPDWLTRGEGSRAELVITISAEKDGTVLLERSQAIPYAGHVLGLIP